MFTIFKMFFNTILFSFGWSKNAALIILLLIRVKLRMIDLNLNFSNSYGIFRFSYSCVLLASAQFLSLEK